MQYDLLTPLNLNFSPMIHMKYPTTRFDSATPEDLPSDLNHFMLSRGIQLSYMAIFYSPPKFFSHECHVDHSTTMSAPARINGKWGSRCKLNFIVGAPEVENVWYEPKHLSDGELESSITDLGQLYYRLPISTCNEVFRSRLSDWNLFEAGQPHSTFNLSNKGRWCYTFVLRDRDTDEWMSYDTCKDRLYDMIR